MGCSDFQFAAKKSFTSTDQTKNNDLFSFRTDSPSLDDQVKFCSLKNSCSTGECKKRHDGLQVCLNNQIKLTKNGEFCQASNNCQNGLCLNRGDGVFICMGNGRQADFCLKDEHCKSGNCRKVYADFAICL